MANFQTILFDVDETLLNFKEGQDNALKQLFAAQGVTLTPTLYKLYSAKNHQLWSAYERQEIGRKQVLAERFTYIFNEVGLVKDGAEMDRIFRDYLKEEAILLPGALDVVGQLAKTHELYIVTNGVSETQHRRLEKAGLQPFFKEVFVSEETGYQKPMQEYFDYVFARIPEIDLTKTIIIGDSLLADIKGGNQAGITSCWYNPSGSVNETGVKPCLEIQSLAELVDIVG